MSGESRTVDGDFSGLMALYSAELGIEMDPANPTRDDRLKLAKAMDGKYDHSIVLEIAAGRHIDFQREDQYRARVSDRIHGRIDQEAFFEGF